MTEGPEADESRLKEANHELQRRIRELEMVQELLESASEGLLIAITPDGVIHSANARTEEMFGYSRGELLGAPVELLLPERFRQRHMAHREEYFRTPRSRPMGIGMLLLGRKKDGTEFPVEISLAYVRRGSQNVVLALISDISERQRAEREMSEKQKLESLGVLAGGLAHDFNNLLTGIIGNASLITVETPPYSPWYQRAQEILLAGHHAANLTRQLLAYAGKGQFQIANLNVVALVNDAISLLHSSIPAPVRLHVEMPGELPPVTGDSGELQELLMSVVTNAVEAIGARPGTIRIEATAVETDEGIVGPYSGTAVPPGKYVRIQVKDTGCGMDDATLARIFDPFFTTKFTGRGLGLAAARGIAAAHRGAIRVTSEPGKGTSFTVFLPASSGAAPTATGAERATTADLSGSGTVLVIDDEETVRDTARAALEHYGYTVLLAEDGPSAIDMMRESGDGIRAVVLDLSMPGMSGVETVPQLKRLQPGVPILLSSGYSEAVAIGRFAGQEFASFIQKPYTAPDLARHVKQVLWPSVDSPSGAHGR